MDFIMYTCPECRRVFKVKGNGKKVKCSKCPNSYLKDLLITDIEWGDLDASAKKRCIENAVSEAPIPVMDPDISDIAGTNKSSHINIPGAVFKCKMCGGRLEVEENESVCTCEYCGTRQTLPKLDDERKINLYDRANHFRRNNEYDKAMGIYEQILNEDSSDAESYWSLVLCRYGIEYVEDPATHTRIPTINRTQYTSIYEDEDYKSALKYADALQKSVYEKEANTINEIQKGILAISNKEEPFDVFICYKETDDSGRRTPDSVLANDLYHQLTQEGFKVFFSRITLEDKLGQEYEPYIFAALNSAKVMVVLGTRPEYFNAIWVKNEWSRYLALIKKDNRKTLIPAYKDMDPYDLPEEFSHLQAQDMTKLGFMQDLIRGIKKITEAEKEKTHQSSTVTVQQGTGNASALLQRGFLALEDKEWNAANSFFEKVLNIDATCAPAYLGKAMAECNIDKKEKLGSFVFVLLDSKNFQKSLRFGDTSFKKEINACFYDRACGYRNEGKLIRAIEIIKSLQDFHDSDNTLDDCLSKLKSVRSCLGPKIEDTKNLKNRIVCSHVYAIGIGSDGKIHATGDNYGGRLNVTGWNGISEISAFTNHTVGLSKDKTVVATGDNKECQCNVSDWKNIISISAGSDHTLGLLEKGTVIATGNNKEKQCDVGGWSNIISISAGFSRSVGLMKDGTVVAVGHNGSGACNVNEWHGIIEVSSGGNHTIGLCSDGTVEAVGCNKSGESDVGKWRNIISVSAGFNHSVGLCIDGTVVATGDNSHGQCDVKDWNNIIAIKAGELCTMGLKSDGTVVMTRTDEKYKIDISEWKLLLSDEEIYRIACEYMNKAEYSKALNEFGRIDNYKNVSELIGLCSEKLLRLKNDLEIKHKERLEKLREKRLIASRFQHYMACSNDFVIGLKADGRIITEGLNYKGRLNVKKWRDITMIEVPVIFSLVLNRDGTADVTGWNKYDFFGDVRRWKNISAIAAGTSHVLGLKEDGTVQAAGGNDYGQCNVSKWTDIIAISCGYKTSIGLRKDGTLVATGVNHFGETDVNDLKNIVAISGGGNHTLALCADGSVKSIGCKKHGECSTSFWDDIVAISAGFNHSVGLCVDGTVVATGDNSHGQCDVKDWNNIIAIKAGELCTMGLKSDGTVVMTRTDEKAKIRLSDFRLF